MFRKRKKISISFSVSWPTEVSSYTFCNGGVLSCPDYWISLCCYLPLCRCRSKMISQIFSRVTSTGISACPCSSCPSAPYVLVVSAELSLVHFCYTGQAKTRNAHWAGISLVWVKASVTSRFRQGTIKHFKADIFNLLLSTAWDCTFPEMSIFIPRCMRNLRLNNVLLYYCFQKGFFTLFSLK